MAGDRDVRQVLILDHGLHLGAGRLAPIVEQFVLARKVADQITLGLQLTLD